MCIKGMRKRRRKGERRGREEIISGDQVLVHTSDLTKEINKWKKRCFT